MFGVPPRNGNVMLLRKQGKMTREEHATGMGRRIFLTSVTMPGSAYYWSSSFSEGKCQSACQVFSTNSHISKILETRLNCISMIIPGCKTYRVSLFR